MRKPLDRSGCSLLCRRCGQWPWEALEQWGDESLASSRSWRSRQPRVERARQRAPRGRSSRFRSDADLAWEPAPPTPRPCRSERAAADPDGGRPAVRRRSGGDDLRGGRSARDAGRLASRGRHARQLHRLTQGWPQRRAGDRRPTSCTPRPGRGSTSARCRLRALLDAEQRGRGSPDVDMRRPRRPQPGNIRMTADRVALITGTSRCRRPRPRPGAAPRRRRSRQRCARHRRASIGRMGGRRLLGRRVHGQAARRGSSGEPRSEGERFAHRPNHPGATADIIDWVCLRSTSYSGPAGV